MRYIQQKRVFAVCALGCVLTAGCSHPQPKDANATCGQPVAQTGMHGHIMTGFGSGLGHMAPRALSAIPGMGGIGGGVAGMGMQQAMNGFGMDHTHGVASSDSFHTEADGSDPGIMPTVPCQPDKSAPPTLNDQDIRFGEEK